MPLPRRIARLQQLILEVAAETIQRRLADPRLGFVTLTRVQLAPDLSEATIFYSTLGSEAERRTTARALTGAAPLVQSIVAKAMATRTTPRLGFRYDATIVHAAHLEDIFEKLRRERGEPTPPPEPPATADDEDEEEDDAEATGAPDDAGRDVEERAGDAGGDGTASGDDGTGPPRPKR